jgi:hypothetical protein
LKQGLTIESQKFKNKIQLMQSILEVIVLECSFLKHTQEILGVNQLLTKNY